MTHKKTILIIDDEEDMRLWLSTFLEDNGYNVVSAVDGAEGFNKAGTGSVDLITLDVSMDNQSGLKTLRLLQETAETRHIPIIMITGVSSDFKTFIERAKQVKMPEGYFEKPVDQQGLIAKIKELVG